MKYRFRSNVYIPTCIIHDIIIYENNITTIIAVVLFCDGITSDQWWATKHRAIEPAYTYTLTYTLFSDVYDIIIGGAYVRKNRFSNIVEVEAILYEAISRKYIDHVYGTDINCVTILLHCTYYSGVRWCVERTGNSKFCVRIPYYYIT